MEEGIQKSFQRPSSGLNFKRPHKGLSSVEWAPGQYLLGVQGPFLLLAGTFVPSRFSAPHAVKVSLIHGQKAWVGNDYKTKAASTLELHRFPQRLRHRQDLCASCFNLQADTHTKQVLFQVGLGALHIHELVGRKLRADLIITFRVLLRPAALRLLSLLFEKLFLGAEPVLFVLAGFAATTFIEFVGPFRRVFSGQLGTRSLQERR